MKLDPRTWFRRDPSPSIIAAPEAKAAGSTFREIGVTGLRRWGENVDDELHPRLKGDKLARELRDMAENSAVIAGYLLLQEMFCRRADWNIVAAGESAEAIACADFVRECQHDMEQSWQEFLSEVLSMSIYGWAWHEMLFKVREDGRIGWRAFAPRAQESLDGWDFDEGGRVRGMFQCAEHDYKRRYIPLAKSLHFRIRSGKNNPEGRSLIRGAYRAWHFCKRIEEIEVVGISRDFAGMMIIEAPPEVMAAKPENTDLWAQRQQLEKLAMQMSRGEYDGCVVPCEMYNGTQTGFKFRLLNSGGTRQIDTSGVIRRLESRMMVVVLAEGQLTGIDKHGSNALRDVATNTLTMSLGGIMEAIQEPINRFAIPMLCQLNGYSREVWPRLQYGDIETPELTQVAAYISQLKAAGFIDADDTIKKHLREYADLPPPEAVIAPELPGEQEEAA